LVQSINLSVDVFLEDGGLNLGKEFEDDTAMGLLEAKLSMENIGWFCAGLSSVIVFEMVERNADVLCRCKYFPDNYCGVVAAFFEPAVVFIEDLYNLNIVLLEQSLENC
jgi:hypothetical protein